MTTVLIIEKDEATCNLYQRELGRSYQVLSSSDANDALELLRDHPIDIIVLEPAIADGDGWRLLESLRRIQPDPPTPVVLCSALDERRRGLKLGATAYLVKPVLPATLLDTLKQVLQS